MNFLGLNLLRLWAVMRKEAVQMRRDPVALRLALLMPVIQLILFGYAVNTDVQHIPMAVVDQCNCAASRRLIEMYENTHYFDVVRRAGSAREMVRLIDAGKVKTGLLIPPEFDRRLLRGERSPVQLLIDGTDSSVASQGLAVANLVAQTRSVQLLVQSIGVTLRTPIDFRPRVLYNPDLKSSNFFIPGLLGIILQMIAVILTSFSVVRERERGTLEQLIASPIKPMELMIGKLLPYALLATIDAVLVLLAAVLIFRVPIHGSLLLLSVLSIVFLLCALGIGLLISTIAGNQAQALQMALFVMMPSFIISGFVFPRETMPLVIYAIGFLIPITYYLVILRGIIVKGIGFAYLWDAFWPMALLGCALIYVSSTRFHKRLE